MADDYKSAALLQRAEEGDSNAVYPRIPSHVKPVMRDADSKTWDPQDRPRSAARDAQKRDEEYEGFV